MKKSKFEIMAPAFLFYTGKEKEEYEKREAEEVARLNKQYQIEYNEDLAEIEKQYKLGGAKAVYENWYELKGDF